MKLDKYTVNALQHGRVSIMFTEPITEGYELSVFMEFFKKYKNKVSLDYELKPAVRILGMICHEKNWIKFLHKINADKAEKAFIDSMRELETVEEVSEYLLKLRNAEIIRF